MRYSYSLLLAFCCWSFSSLAALDASLSYARFQNETGAYLELYTHLAGSTLNWVPFSPGDSLTRAQVDFTILIQQGDALVMGDRFVLNSPVATKKQDFVDLKRYSLAPGDYELFISIVDVADTTNQTSFKTTVTIKGWPLTIAQSDIALLANVDKEVAEDNPFARHGLLMEPLPYNFYGRGANKLAFYHEVYGTNLSIDEKVLLLTKIEKIENGKATPIKAVNKVYSTQRLIPHLGQVDISELPTGNYLLAVEVRSAANELVSRQELSFQRANPLLVEKQREELLANVNLENEFVGQLDLDTLKYCLLALLPLMPQNDIESVNLMVRNKNVEALRMYLFSYWAQKTPANPAAGYEEFMQVARSVDKTFNSGFRYGFESDRGYTYMKYGQPNDINRIETDPSAPPYEIWSYDVIEQTNQHNRRFIFYNPSLAGEDFILLHSDVTGEVNNPQWELMLYKNAPGNQQPGDYIDGTQMQDNMGRQARRIFTDY